jgi:hypothetical protein
MAKNKPATPAPPSENNRGKYPFKEWALNHTERYPDSEYDTIRTAIANLNRNKAMRFRYQRVSEQDGKRTRDFVRVWRVK